MKASLRKVAFFGVLGAIVTASSIACAQQSSRSPIVVRGKVLSLQMESNESYRLKYNADIELRFINVSDHSVIIKKRDPVWMSSEYDRWYEDGELTFRRSELDWGFRYSEINHSAPPADRFAVLYPGDAYIAHSTIPLEFNRDKSINAGDYAYPKSLHTTLELTLTSWVPVYLTRTEEDEMDEVPNDQEIFEYFKNKWAAHGELLAGEIESEPIGIQLPPEPPAPEPTGLVLRGSVTSVGPKQESKDDVTFDVGLHLEFVNGGKKPIIILKPEATGYGHYGVFAVATPSPSYQGATRYLQSNSAGPSCAGSAPEYDSARTAMDQPKPPEDRFWMIKPGESIAFPSNVQLRMHRTRTSRDAEGDITWPDIAEIRDFRMEVTLRIWPTTWIEPSCGGSDNPVFGRKLRDQWSGFGTLELGEMGAISSEPIPLTLPTE